MNEASGRWTVPHDSPRMRNPSGQAHRRREWTGGCGEGGAGKLLLSGHEIAVMKEEKVLQIPKQHSACY